MMATIVVVLAVALAFAIVVGLWLFLAWRNAPERRLKRRVQDMRIESIPRFAPPAEPNTLTVSEAERRYGVNGRTLRRWLKERKVAGWKDGRMWMIDRRSLEKFLKERWK